MSGYNTVAGAAPTVYLGWVKDTEPGQMKQLSQLMDWGRAYALDKGAATGLTKVAKEKIDKALGRG